MTTMPDEHEEWSQLAVGHALSSLDETDEAMYLEHAASCETCRELASGHGTPSPRRTAADEPMKTAAGK